MAGADGLPVKYDPMGNRVFKSVDTGSLKRKYAYAGAQPLAMHDHYVPTDPNVYETYLYLHDRLGSVRQVLDTSANVKNTYTYQPFGEDFTAECAETVDNPFKFTGQYFDKKISHKALPSNGQA